jgi:hypothetical protein
VTSENVVNVGSLAGPSAPARSFPTYRSHAIFSPPLRTPLPVLILRPTTRTHISAHPAAPEWPLLGLVLCSLSSHSHTAFSCCKANAKAWWEQGHAPPPHHRGLQTKWSPPSRRGLRPKRPQHFCVQLPRKPSTKILGWRISCLMG